MVTINTEQKVNEEEKDYDEEEVAFQIILHSGNAKSLCLEAIKAAREKNFEKSDQLFAQASKELTEAHNCQTESIRRSLLAKNAKINLLMVHAQDHIMNAITINDLAKEIAKTYKK